MNTPYNELSEKEKDSYREQADKIIKLLKDNMSAKTNKISSSSITEAIRRIGEAER